MTPHALGPLLPLLLIVATDLWVYLDDRSQGQRGTPVEFVLGAFRIDAPAEWMVACTLMWIIFFPLYLVGRSQ